jgi:hypothetical protein
MMQEYMIDIPKNSSKVQFFISYYSPTFRFLCPLHRLPPLGPTAALLHSGVVFTLVSFTVGCKLQPVISRIKGIERKKTKILEKYITCLEEE